MRPGTVDAISKGPSQGKARDYARKISPFNLTAPAYLNGGNEPYAKVDVKFYEITKEVAKAMLSAYRNEVYRSKKWQPEDPETMTRKTKWTELLDCVFSENTDGIGVQDIPDE